MEINPKALCVYNIGVNCSKHKGCENCGWYKSGISPTDWWNKNGKDDFKLEVEEY